MNKITFKSTTEFYEKEQVGLKKNTIRETDNRDERFILLNEYSNVQNRFFVKPLYIEIVNAENPNLKFQRKIKDITFYKQWTIISW